MKSLYLIRHAKSSKEDASLRDFDRPLHRKGQDEAALMAACLKLQGVVPDLIISSPAKRALSTAVYFAEALMYPIEKIQQESCIYEAEPSALYDVIHQISDKCQTVLLFGHNPGISLYIEGYSGGMGIHVPTCGVAQFKFASADWGKFRPDQAIFVNLQCP